MNSMSVIRVREKGILLRISLRGYDGQSVDLLRKKNAGRLPDFQDSTCIWQLSGEPEKKARLF